MFLVIRKWKNIRNLAFLVSFSNLIGANTLKRGNKEDANSTWQESL